MRRRLVAFVFVAAAAFGAAHCETHQCDTSTVAYGGDAGPPMGSTLQMIGDQMIWWSSPNEGPWLDFLGNRTFVFTFPVPFACEAPTPTVALAGNGEDPQGTMFASGVAGLALFGHDLPDDAGLYRSITVTNSSCAAYGLQLIMTGTPPGAPCLVQIFDAGEGGGGGQEAADVDAGADGVPE